MSQDPITVKPDSCLTDVFTAVSIDAVKRGDDRQWVLSVQDRNTSYPTKTPRSFKLVSDTIPEIKRNDRVKISWLPGPDPEIGSAVSVAVLDDESEKKARALNPAKQKGDPDYICAAGKVVTAEQLACEDESVIDQWVVWLEEDVRAFVLQIDPDDANELVGKGISLRAVEVDASEFDLPEAKSVYRVAEYKEVESPTQKEIEKARAEKVDKALKTLSRMPGFNDVIETLRTEAKEARESDKTITISATRNESEPEWSFGIVESVTLTDDTENEGPPKVVCRLVGDNNRYAFTSEYPAAPQEGDDVGFGCVKEEKYHGDSLVVLQTKKFAPAGTAVTPVFPTTGYDQMNESVAVVKELKRDTWITAPPDRHQWRLTVKHRTAGPKRYILAFIPDADKFQPNTLVRIYWLAKSDEAAKKEAVALRVDPIGDVTYRDER